MDWVLALSTFIKKSPFFLLVHPDISIFDQTIKMFASLLNVITFKQKSRYDYTCDQYTRLFMPKLFFAASIIMTWNYFNDQITCAISDDVQISHDFVHSTCWINGFYVLHEMHDRTEYSAYYGIPRDIDKDGITHDGRSVFFL